METPFNKNEYKYGGNVSLILPNAMSACIRDNMCHVFQVWVDNASIEIFGEMKEKAWRKQIKGKGANDSLT